LTVLTLPPSITTQPQSHSVLAGGSATFSVTATGTAPLSYQWTHAGTNLSGANASSLTISSAQPDNAGDYVALVSSPYGSTNSTTATLTILPPSGTGYVLFVNSLASPTKIFTNAYVGGQVTGLAGTGVGSYLYALFASASATTVNGYSNSVLGAANAHYAFLDNNWTLVAYGKSTAVRGRLTSTSTDNSGQTPVIGFAGGAGVRFVIVGWSANIGNDIAAVQTWFNNGSPASDGWIGQSAVSGLLQLGDGAIIPAPVVMGPLAPALQGFALGLASPNPSASYPPPGVPAPVISSTLMGNTIKLSWPAFYSNYGLQSSSSMSGPWADLGLTPVSDGTNLSVTIPLGSQQPFYRLIVMQ